MSRILLIDDDDSVRRMINLALSRLGHAVTEAGNGKEGLALLDRKAFDLVITDIVMPEMEGIEVLMALRKRQPPMKTIAISGGGCMAAVDYLQMAKTMGATTVLEKPFTTAALATAVAETLRGGDPSSDAPAAAQGA